MKDIQRIEGSVPYQAIQYDTFAEDHQEASVVKSMLIITKKWRMITGLSLLASILIIPFVWLIGKNYYETEGAIRVTPIVSPILFRNMESDIPMPNYENFVNTQASLMTSNNVLNRVADELNGKNLEFFEGADDYAIALKVAVRRSKIDVEPIDLTELVKLSMKTPNPREAEQILNAFIKAYMAVIASDEVKGGDQKLAILEEKRRLMEGQISKQREEIRRLGDEFGSVALEGRQEMMLQQVVSMQNEVTALEMQKMSLEASVNMKESGTNEIFQPGELMQMRNEFVNTDLAMQTLAVDFAAQETLVHELRQVMATDSVRLTQQAGLVSSLKQSIEKRKQEVLAKFDSEFEVALVKNQQYHLADLKSQLEKTIEYEKRMRGRLEKANSEAIRMGRKQLAINNLQEKLTRMKETSDAVNRRIDELEMERKRPARVSIAYMASSVPAQSTKINFSVVIILGSIGLSSLLILLLEKLDTSLRGPEDLVSRIGINIIGTTTSPDKIDSIILARQLMEDYQTIRANIGLINAGSSKKIIAVTSPGVGDGKTTFSVNLATSFAKSGKKTLLIDGDLRKPDIAATLKLPESLRGLQDLFEGMEPQKAIYRMASTGIDILAADRSNTTDALDFLAQPNATEIIRSICRQYDHVIIDTPPVLAFTDALLWAKIVDGVVLTTYVDRTCSSELKETVKRLSQIDAMIIGAVVNNVQLTDSYHQSGLGYGYGADFGSGGPFKDSKDSALLLATDPVEELTS